MTRILLLALMGTVLLACTQPQQNTPKGKPQLQDERIRAELVKLMEKEGPYTFVVFEEPSTGKFVQFAGSKNEELLFDLPSDQLSKEEFDRAKAILATYDITHEISPTYTDATETVEAGTLAVFSTHINNDIDLAVELTSRIMMDVFGFDATVELTIQTD